MESLAMLAELSREFGTTDYVVGGGGNTSFKDATSLWIKPSGTTLAGLSAASFVAMSRAKVRELYAVDPPADPVAREALVKDTMLAAVRSDSSGRPSVEAPLHESFTAAFVVHTHPPLVNGMTCGRQGAQACRSLFPDALWIDFTDPGYTVCMAVREELRASVERCGRQPSAVFLENHGVFVAGQTPEDIRETYRVIMERLRSHYRQTGTPLELAVGLEPTPAAVKAMTERLRTSVGAREAAFVCASGAFPVAEGPVTPDHIVYMKSHPMVGDPTPEAVAAFRADRGYSPRVIAYQSGVYGLGTTAKNADLALALALDGALVMQLAEAFGGVKFMTPHACRFIDTWEVESYRRKLAAE